ncbi:MAG: SMC-Scp complex subunit ScpB, partial [Mesorhizobium sp.]
MSERANASVIPFKVDDETEEGVLAGASAESQTQNLSLNPGERLHMAEAVRMAEAIVFASAEPVSEKQLAARLPDG